MKFKSAKKVNFSGTLNFLKEKFKNMSKKQKRITALVLVAAILVSVAAFKKISGGKPKTSLLEGEAEIGNVQTYISGTATVEANAQYDVTSLVKGEVMEDCFEEGQEVSKGDVLYKIDTTDAQNSVDRARLSLEKSQNSYNSTLNDINKLNVSAPCSGTITDMYVSEGDEVGANTKICEITDSSTFTLQIPFIAEDAANIRAGQTAAVTLSSSGQTIYGTVTRVGSGNMTNSYGVIVKYVDISVTNPGALTDGEEAVAKVGSYACQDSGKLEYAKSKTVVAEVSGTVGKINKKQGDYVTSGVTVVTLKSSSLSDSAANSRLSLKEAELSLQNTEDALDDYTITAPISGTVIKKTTKAGDTLDNSNSTTVMCVIADYSKTTIELAIDELDLADVSVGQDVEIEADAFPGKMYSGTVEYISQVGTASMGATSYPVTIVINNPENLIVGMNVSAKIITQSAENAVVVPQSAVLRGDIVFVKKSDVSDDSALADEKYLANIEIPSGYSAVKVETGITDGVNVEIKSGLSKGDGIAYYTVSASEKSGGESSAMGGMPGGGGGMPGGGMSGGMPGGGGGMPSGGGGGMPGGGF